MKTYKRFIHEKYVTSNRSKYLEKPIAVYVNPSRAELFKLIRGAGEDGVRGFLFPDGTIYITDGIHQDILDNVKLNVYSAIPFLIDKDKREIAFGDMVYNTKWNDNKDKAKDVLKNNKFIKNNLGDYVVTGELY